jgi:predicted anti-sigma-YlaC factor YlaD
MTDATQTPTNACDLHEADLSAVLDGELETVDLLRTLDHLVECSRCAEFYRRSRDLDLTVAESRQAESRQAESREAESWEEGEAIEPSDDVWHRIADNAPWAEDEESASMAPVASIRRRRSRVMEWAPRLAAVFVVGFGLWMVYAVSRDVGSAEFFSQASESSVEASVDVLSDDDLSESTIESDDASVRAEMDEQRFVQLATEVLEADPRFHQEMLRVMKTATRADYREAAVDARRVEEGRDLAESRRESGGGAGERDWK